MRRRKTKGEGRLRELALTDSKPRRFCQDKKTRLSLSILCDVGSRSYAFAALRVWVCHRADDGAVGDACAPDRQAATCVFLSRAVSRPSLGTIRTIDECPEEPPQCSSIEHIVKPRDPTVSRVSTEFQRTNLRGLSTESQRNAGIYADDPR